jgi:hypothetical protein
MYRLPVHIANNKFLISKIQLIIIIIIKINIKIKILFSKKIGTPFQKLTNQLKKNQFLLLILFNNNKIFNIKNKIIFMKRTKLNFSNKDKLA